MKKTRCPICAAPVVAAHTPFCSRGCKDRDLLQWLGDGYRLPGPTVDAMSGEGDTQGLDSDHDDP